MPFELDRLLLLAISLASAVLAVGVYSRAPDRVWNRLFGVQAFGVAVWVYLNYLLQSADTVGQADLWLRLTHPAVALVICSCVDLFWVFPEQTTAAPVRLRVGLYATGALFSLAGLAPNLYRALALTGGTVLVEYDWPFLAFGVFAIGTLGYADYVLFRKMPALTGIQRAQVKYVLTGMVVGQFIALMTMVLLPLIWHNTFYARWGSASYILVIGSMAYAIAQHSLVRPAVALTRIGAYLLSGAAVALMMALLLAAGHRLWQSPGGDGAHLYLAGGVLIGLTAVALHLTIRQRLEHALPGAQRAEGLRQASEAVLRTLDSQELPESLAVLIRQLLQATHVGVFMAPPSGGSFELAAQATAPGGRRVSLAPVVRPDAMIVAMISLSHDLLDRSQVRRFQSFTQAELLLPEMRRYDAEVVAPILWEDHLMGLVVIGERMAGDMYGPEELQMVRNLLPQISLAVRNADLFDGVVQMKQYYENILRQMQSGVIAVNADRSIAMINPAAEEALGLRAQNVIGKPLELLPEKIAARLSQALSGVPVRPEDRLEVENARGEKIPVACSTSRWRGSPLVAEGAIAVISDLTLLEALEHERRDAEHLMVVRLLTAGMAHELRNPLVAIRTFAELLPTRWEDPEFRTDFLRTAQDEIDRIDRLLADMLMLSKPADAVVEPIPVNVVCEGVVRVMSATAEAKGVHLQTDLTLGTEGRFLGDRSRLHQALVNLVKNAVEAEPEGGRVRVTTEETLTEEAAPAVLITVHNESSYIPDDQLELIFQPFYTRRAGGTGLGLPVSQTIIQEHHGTIRVLSGAGAGTSFLVELPLNAVSTEPAYDRRAHH
jgi:PAS domain S-box-containing protein